MNTSTETVFPPHRSVPAFDAILGVHHGFFGRLGGVSTGVYASLNTGSGSNDSAEAVAENRARIAQTLGIAPDGLLTVNQVHSADVVIVSAPFDAERPKADGIVTRTPGLALGALAADCAPVLFADTDTPVIAAAHAGWRGAFAGVTDSVLSAMEDIGANRATTIAAIGPCISQSAYEVGPEFVERFRDATPENAQFFIPGKDDRSHFDLKAYVGHRLRQAGIGTVVTLADCTYSDPTRYFSYRRKTQNGEPDYGRNLSVIALSNSSE